MAAEEHRRNCIVELSRSWLGMYSRWLTLDDGRSEDCRRSADSVQYSWASRFNVTLRRPEMSLCRDSGDGCALRYGVGEKNVLRRATESMYFFASCNFGSHRELSPPQVTLCLHYHERTQSAFVLRE